MDTIIFYIFNNSLLIFVYGFNAIESITENNVMCCLIDSSWWTNQVISRCIQCSTTGVTKAVVYAILSVGWGIYRTLAANQKE